MRLIHLLRGFVKRRNVSSTRNKARKWTIAFCVNFAQKPFWYELNELQFYEMKTQWNFG